jgi:RNA polymerase sigma-70 factor (ECF subfamily)
VTDPTDEVDLMRRTSKGDAAAFRHLASTHTGPIMSYAYRILQDRAEAEDVAQETLLRLWKDAGRYQPTAKVSTWLHRIAHNLCIDRLRARRERSSDHTPEARTSDEPASLLQEKRVATAVEDALATLPERQRAALTLVHFQGFGNIEAAQILDIGVDALESLLARGRRSLREQLAEHRAEGPLS